MFQYPTTLPQIQEFAQEPANRQVLEAQCVTLLNLLDPMIEDAVERENDYNLPRTIASIGGSAVHSAVVIGPGNVGYNNFQLDSF